MSFNRATSVFGTFIFATGTFLKLFFAVRGRGQQVEETLNHKKIKFVCDRRRFPKKKTTHFHLTALRTVKS